MSGEAYSKRYGAGGFVDLPSQTTSIDSQFLNGVEAALARLLGADPTDAMVQVWDAGLGRFKTIKLTANNLDPAAGIAKSQLAPLAIVDTDVAAGANIAASKIGGNIPISKLTGFPNDITKKLQGDGSWQPSGVTRTVLTSGSGTYTTPAGCRAILVECTGAGGGGGGCATVASAGGSGNAGGGGSYAASLIQNPAATYAYAVGNGGPGGAAGANPGTVGDDTSFGTVLGKGGAAGGGGTAQTTVPQWIGVSAGFAAGSTGDIVIPGKTGRVGALYTVSNVVGTVGGEGGGPYAGDGGAARTAGGAGAAGTRAGGGASGGVVVNGSASAAGAAGGAGLIVVTEYY